MSQVFRITEDAESEIRPELATDENLLWSGRPRQGLTLRASDWFVIPFSLLWGGFALFWEATVLGLSVNQQGANPTSAFMALFGLPFVVIGLYLIFGRFLVDAWIRKNTTYALTDQRALVLRNNPW